MIVPYQEILPKVDPSAFIDQTAIVIGDVELGPRASIFFYAVVRGDVNFIRIGARTNVQDGAVIHVTYQKWPTFIGDDTVIGHRAVVHGCRVGNHCLVGMNAVVLDGAEIGDNSMVAAGAVVTPGFKAPPYSLLAGVPAKRVRDVTDKDLTMIDDLLNQYLNLADHYRPRDSRQPML